MKYIYSLLKISVTIFVKERPRRPHSKSKIPEKIFLEILQNTRLGAEQSECFFNLFWNEEQRMKYQNVQVQKYLC